MRPIAPRLPDEFGTEVTFAEDQLEFMPLVATHVRCSDDTRQFLARWTFTAEERKRIAAGEDIGLLVPYMPPHSLSLLGDLVPPMKVNT